MQRGQVVVNLAGRDAGKLSAVMGSDNGMLLLCDGKERPLSRPKRKNTKHVIPTNNVLEEQQYQSDKALRRALKALSATGIVKEAKVCQKRI